MSLDLVTYSGDRRMDLAIAECIRKPVWGDSWTRVRIGLQLNFPGATAFAANLTGSPAFAFGVCSGDASGFGAGAAGSTTHAMGLYTNAATWTYGSTAFSLGTTGRTFKKAGTTITNSSIPIGTSYLSGLDTVRVFVGLELTKASPVSMEFQHAFPTNTASANSDVTDAKFIEFMELGTDFASITGVKAGYQSRPANAIAYDEGTDGTLDHIFVQWDKSTLPLSFNIRHRKIA